MVELIERWDRVAARSHLDRATELAPDDVEFRVSLAFVAAASGEPTEASSILQSALDQDPVTPVVRADAGWVYYLIRRYDRASELCAMAAELEPSEVGAEDCAQYSLVALGRLDEAVRRIRAALLRWDLDPDEVPWSANDAPQDQLVEYWRWRAVRLSRRADSWPYLEATLYARIGWHERALDALETSLDRRVAMAVAITVDPTFDALRRLKRYQELSTRLGSASPADGTDDQA